MRAFSHLAVRVLLVMSIATALPAHAADALAGNLVDGAWLEANLGRADILVLDASPAQQFVAQHIPGAVNIDVFSYGAQEIPVAEMETRLRSWGVSDGKTIVLYDAGGTFLATRLFFTLAYYGYPEEKLAVLDGGMTRWQADGRRVSKEASTPPTGSFRITAVDETLRVRLPEFLTASGDRAGSAVVDALGPDWHYGQTAPFSREGHIPNSVLFPAADFFNADKTFKSRDELRKMAAFLDVRPDQQVFTYCGGGIAASVPFFALKYLLHYPKVGLFIESQLGWIRDERDLPLSTYDVPHLLRDSAWLQAWNGRMMRMYGVSNISVIDIRPKAAFDEGHLPFSLNIPAGVFRNNVSEPGKLAAVLGAAGVDPSHEAVIVSGAGLTGEAALAWALLEKIGQKKVSVLTSVLDAPGFTLTKDPTAVGMKNGNGDLSIQPVAWSAVPRTGFVITDTESAPGPFPRVFIAAGKSASAKEPERTVVPVTPADLLTSSGAPKPAKEIWGILAKAGVPRYAEIVTIADDPGDAASVFFILKLMGFADAKMLAGSGDALDVRGHE
ncbi:MAG: rhodanese-like domain-containing protein [Thermoanaerobaculia bacterium]